MCDGSQVDKLSRDLQQARQKGSEWRLLAEQRQLELEQLSLEREGTQKVHADSASCSERTTEPLYLTAEDGAGAAGGRQSTATSPGRGATRARRSRALEAAAAGLCASLDSAEIVGECSFCLGHSKV